MNKTIAVSAWFVWCLSSAWSVPAAEAGVTGGQVRSAVDRGLRFLREQRKDDGHWRGSGHEGGMTGLCLVAMLNAGVDPGDGAIVRGIRALDSVPNRWTYTVSL